MKKLNLAVLGLGEGRSIISAASSSNYWDISMICDVNEELCLQMQRSYSIPAYTLDYSEVLNTKEIDVIGIYTPDHLHASHIIQALDAGKHVICTKPLMTGLSEARQILRASERSGCHVMVGQSSRFFEPMMRQRKVFQEGELGELATMEAYYNADHRWFLEKPWARSEGFKWLFGGLSHPIDLVRWYFPDVSEVMAYGDITSNGAEKGLKHEDIIHIIFKTSMGRTARVSGTYSCPMPPEQRDSGMSCILRGTRGASQADYHELRYSEHIEGSEPRIIHFDREDFYFRFKGLSHHAGEYQNYIDYFARCIESGETPLPDLKEGLVTVACMLAVDRSLLEGRPVRVDEILREENLGYLMERQPSSRDRRKLFPGKQRRIKVEHG